jgi:O-antigen ligase
LALAAGGLLLVVSFAAGSRVGAALLAVEVLWLAWRWGGKRKLLEGGLALVGLASLFVILSPAERLRNPGNGDHRVEIWSSAVEMIRARPWIGWGVDQFPVRYPAFAKFDNGEFVNAAHSDWLEWGVEIGIGGLLLPGMLLGWYLRRFRHSPAVWGILFGALHAAVDFPWQQPGFLVLSAMLGGTFAQYASKTSRSPSYATQSANTS